MRLRDNIFTSGKIEECKQVWIQRNGQAEWDRYTATTDLSGSVYLPPGTPITLYVFGDAEHGRAHDATIFEAWIISSGGDSPFPFVLNRRYYSIAINVGEDCDDFYIVMRDVWLNFSREHFYHEEHPDGSIAACDPNDYMKLMIFNEHIRLHKEQREQNARELLAAPEQDPASGEAALPERSGDCDPGSPKNG